MEYCNKNSFSRNFACHKSTFGVYVSVTLFQQPIIIFEVEHVETKWSIKDTV